MSRFARPATTISATSTSPARGCAPGASGLGAVAHRVRSAPLEHGQSRGTDEVSIASSCARNAERGESHDDRDHGTETVNGRQPHAVVEERADTERRYPVAELIERDHSTG